jgi:hypothetical protein
MTKKIIANKPTKYNQPKGPLRIDFGCGKNKRDGFLGVDVLDFAGVDIKLNAGKDKWPWKDGSVDEIYASHFLEHLLPAERIHFVNELHRVLKAPVYSNGMLVSGFATVITPHWASQRAYGDLTHVWPPVSEFWFYYLDKDWRAINAPHNQDYKCHLSVTWGYNMHPEVQLRNSEYQQNAMKFWKEACADTIAQITRKESDKN